MRDAGRCNAEAMTDAKNKAGATAVEKMSEQRFADSCNAVAMAVELGKFATPDVVHIVVQCGGKVSSAGVTVQ